MITLNIDDPASVDYARALKRADETKKDALAEADLKTVWTRLSGLFDQLYAAKFSGSEIAENPLGSYSRYMEFYTLSYNFFESRLKNPITHRRFYLLLETYLDEKAMEAIEKGYDKPQFPFDSGEKILKSFWKTSSLLDEGDTSVINSNGERYPPPEIGPKKEYKKSLLEIWDVSWERAVDGSKATRIESGKDGLKTHTDSNH